MAQLTSHRDHTGLGWGAQVTIYYDEKTKEIEIKRGTKIKMWCLYEGCLVTKEIDLKGMVVK